MEGNADIRNIAKSCFGGISATEGVPGMKNGFFRFCLAAGCLWRREGKGLVIKMSVSAVNDVNSYNQTTVTATTPSAATTEAAKNDSVKETGTTTTTKKESDAAVYDKSESTEKTTYKPNTALVEKLKADAEARTAQMRSLVEKMMMKQGQTVNGSMDYLMALKNGTLKVDAATRKQAQDDISEDGYWGVKQTSDRLVSFAKALTGGDPSKADEMMKAIEKGFKQATKAWGGDLPDICQKTLEATREKVNEWKKSNSTQAAETVAE